jgi:hypothetical protein
MSATLAAPPAGAPSSTPLRPAGPAIRLVPTPRTEPPTDEERRAAGLDAPALSAMALPLAMPGDRRTRRRPASTAPAEEPGPPAPLEVIAATHPVAPIESPSPARLAARRFLGTCLEVLGGYRPVTHLRPFCFPDRYADIAERLLGHATSARTRAHGLAHLARAPAVGRSTGAPPRSGRGNQIGPGDRIAIRRVQVCEAINGVAEIAVVLARRDHVWAMAVRMECRRGSWLCTYLEVL